jgi:hypothetical protein
MTATTMINAMVVVVDIVGAVAIASKILKEIIPTMHLAPMIGARYVARWVTLH